MVGSVGRFGRGGVRRGPGGDNWGEMRRPRVGSSINPLGLGAHELSASERGGGQPSALGGR